MSISLITSFLLLLCLVILSIISGVKFSEESKNDAYNFFSSLPYAYLECLNSKSTWQVDCSKQQQKSVGRIVQQKQNGPGLPRAGSGLMVGDS